MFTDSQNESLLIEKISEYVFNNDKKIFDVITIHDIFKNQETKQPDGSHTFNYLNGTGILKYYMFNMNFSKINHYENGLVTI